MTEATGKAAKEHVYPLSQEQEAIWLDEHMHGGPSPYLESWAYRIVGPLDLDAVSGAFAFLARRHEALRTTFTLRGDALVQVVTQPQVSLEVRPCRTIDLGDELQRTVARPLDLEVMAWRVVILQLAPEDHILVVQVHHVLVDDWAFAILDEEFGEAYRAQVQGRPPNLSELPGQMGDYALAQRAVGTSTEVRAYWAGCLSGLPSSGRPPHGGTRQTGARSGAQVRFALSPERGRQVRSSARRLRATPFIVLLSALAVVISAHENTRDVIIGTPVSRRGSGGLDHVIGCLTDLFPLRQTLSPGESFADLVARGKHLVHGAIVHRDISYAEIQRLAAPRLRPGMARLCETVLVVDDAGTDRLQVVGAQAERLYVPPSVAKFDLCLTLVAEGDGYLGLLDYATDLRNEADARQLADDYCRALDRLLASPDVPLGDAVGKCATRVIV